MKAAEKLRKLRKELNDIVVERETQIDAMLAALIAGVHILLLGPPGTAKSMLANLLCASIEGTNFFQWLLSKFSTPEELFGPISMSGLKKDQYTRVTTGKMPEAHISFLDEIFKANSAILNSLLTLINERKFHNNGKPVDVPLLMCVGASNELPQGEELGALYDRFLLRFWTDYIENDDVFIDLVDPNGNVGKGKPETAMTLDEIEELRKALSTIKVPRDILENIREINRDLKNSGIVASDRRWKAAVHTLRAFALLDGRNEVTGEDLERLADMMWDRPENKRKILEILAPYGNPLNLKASEYLDAAQEIFNNWNKDKADDSDDAKALQANGMLKEILKKIDADLDGRPDSMTRKLRQTREAVAKMREQVVSSIDL